MKLPKRSRHEVVSDGAQAHRAGAPRDQGEPLLPLGLGLLLVVLGLVIGQAWLWMAGSFVGVPALFLLMTQRWLDRPGARSGKRSSRRG